MVSGLWPFGWAPLGPASSPRVTAPGFDGFGSGCTDTRFKGQCAIRKEMQWLVLVFCIKTVWDNLLTWKNVFLWTPVFCIKLYSLYGPSGISYQAKNHLTDISKRKLNVIFFNCILFISMYFFPFYWRNQMERKAGACPLPGSPLGTGAGHSWAAAPLPHWPKVMTGLSRFRG